MGFGGSGVADGPVVGVPILFEAFGSSRDIAISSKREVAASSLSVEPMSVQSISGKVVRLR